MSDISFPLEQLKAQLEKLEQELEGERTEKGKIKTRLSGYETVAKLATERAKENDQLKRKVGELERQIKDLTEMKSDKQSSRDVASLSEETAEKNTNNDGTTDAYLTDLQSSLASSTHTHQNGSTTSFSIIGKSSSDAHLKQQSHDLGNSAPIPDHNVDTKQDIQYTDFTCLSLGTNKNPALEKSKSRAKDLNHSYFSPPEIGGKTPGPDTRDKYIQVFPDTSQSGGSNCSGSSFEKDVEGPSCLNSSRAGPLSMLDICNGSMTSYVQVGKKEVDEDPVQLEEPKTVVVDPISLQGQPVDASSYNGTGARPKQSVLRSRSTSNDNVKLNDTKDSTENSNKNLLVKIPVEGTGSFRINNAPMLSYGRNDSQTEISALTSFGSSLDATSPDRLIGDPGQYNDLNMGNPPIIAQTTPSEPSRRVAQEELKEESYLPVPSTKLLQMERKSLSIDAQRIRNILSSKSNITETRNIILPFLERAVELENALSLCQMDNKVLKGQIQRLSASLETGEKENRVKGSNQEHWVVVDPREVHSDNDKVSKELVIDLKDEIDTLKKEIEILNSKTSQLHMANKEWKDRWELLKKQKENENLQLRADMIHFKQQNEQYKHEMENVVTSQKEELLQANLSKKESGKNYTHMLCERSQEKQLLEQLKQDYGNLHQEKRALEIQVEKLSERIAAHSNTSTNVTNTSELETELAIVKRQVTLFMEDFNKEHQEKMALEMKLQKEKESQHSLEVKLKKSHSLLKARDEDLRKRAKQVSDLQYQVDDLKLKLEVEQRRSSIYPSMDVPTSSPFIQQENAAISYGMPSSIVAPPKGGNGHTVAYPPYKASKTHGWNCSHCTFRNKINLVKCEMCGHSNSGSDAREPN